VALEEGRLNLHEYDERLREAYAARTYADLDALVADIPGVTPASKSQLVPADTTGHAATTRWQAGVDGRYPGATRRWVAEQWDTWVPAVAVCVAIWAVSSILSGEWHYFWPGWVAGPWGALLFAQTIRGLMSGEPQRWAANRARKEAAREVRRRADRDGADNRERDAIEGESSKDDAEQ
jgi:hypothetical protein